jgi:hypothetical protein
MITNVDLILTYSKVSKKGVTFASKSSMYKGFELSSWSFMHGMSIPI